MPSAADLYAAFASTTAIRNDAPVGDRPLLGDRQVSASLTLRPYLAAVSVTSGTRTISIRRFCARPSALSLDATGWCSP